jgi:hypothetical protein
MRREAPPGNSRDRQVGVNRSQSNAGVNMINATYGSRTSFQIQDGSGEYNSL